MNERDPAAIVCLTDIVQYRGRKKILIGYAHAHQFPVDVEKMNPVCWSESFDKSPLSICEQCFQRFIHIVIGFAGEMSNSLEYSVLDLTLIDWFNSHEVIPA
jgi:hypothetical protein